MDVTYKASNWGEATPIVTLDTCAGLDTTDFSEAVNVTLCVDALCHGSGCFFDHRLDFVHTSSSERCQCTPNVINNQQQYTDNTQLYVTSTKLTTAT